MQHPRLTHPRFDSWVAVEIHERDGRYMATSDLAEASPGMSRVGETPQEAVRVALRSLGEPHASEMAAGVRDEDATP